MPWPAWLPASSALRVSWRTRDRGAVGAPGGRRHGAHAGESVVVATGTASGKSLAYQLPALTRWPSDTGRVRALLSPHQGPGRATSCAACAALDRAVRARGRLRRRHPDRGAGLGAAALANWVAHQPRHAAPRDPARAHQSGAHVPAAAAPTSSSTSATPTAGCSARTSGTCCAGCAGSAGATARSPSFVLASATVADPARRPPAAGRAGARRSPRTARRAGRDVRAVGAAADRAHRRARGAGAARGRRRGGRAARRPGRAGRPDAGVRPVPARRRVGRPSRPGGCSPSAGWPTWCAGSTPTAAATCPRSGASWSARCRAGGCWGWRRRTRWSSASTSPAWTRCVLAGYPGTLASLWQQAGRAGRARTESLVVFVARDDPLDTYLAHHPRARVRPAGRGDGHSTRPTPTCSGRSCAAPPPSCRCAPEADLPEFGGAGRRGAARRAGRRRAAPAPAGRLVLGRRAGRPDVDIRGSGERAGRRSSRPAPAGCSARSTAAPRTRRCTPARSTCTRARRSSSTSSTSTTRAPWCTPRARSGRPSPGTSPTSRIVSIDRDSAAGHRSRRHIRRRST